MKSILERMQAIGLNGGLVLMFPGMAFAGLDQRLYRQLPDKVIRDRFSTSDDALEKYVKKAYPYKDIVPVILEKGTDGASSCTYGFFGEFFTVLGPSHARIYLRSSGEDRSQAALCPAKEVPVAIHMFHNHLERYLAKNTAQLADMMH